MPNGLRHVTRGQASDRSSQQHTEQELEQGPIPRRIPRIWWDNNKGLVGDDVNFTPTTSDSQIQIPNHGITRMRNRSHYASAVPLHDDTMQVDAFGFGDPNR